VTEQDIANIVAQWTGIPIEKVSADETERLIKMEEVLHGRVIGQVSPSNLVHLENRSRHVQNPV
jgi:ATP-dependent Clp protease ATP-binding subunit ClpA